MTATLLTKLNEPNVIRHVKGVEELPALVNIFSRRLNRLTPALRGLGIEVSIWHKEDGSYCSLKRLGHFVKEADALTRQASGDPSVTTTKKGKDFKPADGSDGSERFDDAPIKELPPKPEAHVQAPAQEDVADNQVAVKGGAA
jgi:hypothetical protein